MKKINYLKELNYKKICIEDLMLYPAEELNEEEIDGFSSIKKELSLVLKIERKHYLIGSMWNVQSDLWDCIDKKHIFAYKAYMWQDV